jgi:hypothetical protein
MELWLTMPPLSVLHGSDLPFCFNLLYCSCPFADFLLIFWHRSYPLSITKVTYLSSPLSVIFQISDTTQTQAYIFNFLLTYSRGYPVGISDYVSNWIHLHSLAFSLLFLILNDRSHFPTFRHCSSVLFILHSHQFLPFHSCNKEFLFVCFMVLRFELRSLLLVGSHSTTWAKS